MGAGDSLAVTRRGVTAGLGAALLAGTTRRARAQGAAGAPIRIGVISDQSGPYSAPGGPGSVVGARLAAQDFGNAVGGRPVEILVGDHQNKPDVGVGIVRHWLDVDGVDAITDGGSSAVALAIQDIMREKRKLFLITGSTSNEFTGKQCSPTGFQWQTDTYSTASAAVRAEVGQGRRTFYFLTADYTFGYDLERFATAGIEAAGGKVLGHTRFPLGTPDFSSALLQAQSSGAQVVALGCSGADAVNAIKQAQEFGIMPRQSVTDLALYISDIEGMGREAAQNLSWVTSFYWDRNDASRAWTKRFEALRSSQLPTRLHAGTYSAVYNYLASIRASNSTDGMALAARMRATPLQDPLFPGATIREDGRVMLDQYLMRNKTAREATGPRDYAAVVATVPAAEAYRPLAQGGCSLVQASK